METATIGYALQRRALTSQRIVHPFDLPNLTERTLNAMFPAVPETAVRHRHLLVTGQPESGKTTLLNFLAHEAIKRYGRFKVNLIAVRKISDGLDRIDSSPVQVMFIDDAVRSANARTSGKQAEDVADFFEVRHIFEDRTSFRAGVIITIWAAQRFKSLDIVFRNAHAIIFKTIAADPADSKEMLRYIGLRPFDRLQKITDEIYGHANDAIKSDAIVCLPFANKSGTFRYWMTTLMLNFNENPGVNDSKADPLAPFSFDVGPILEKYQKNRNWRKDARAYYLDRFEQLTYAEIGADPQIQVAISTVHRRIAKMRGELSRLAGGMYEKWKGEQLRARGYEAELNGKIGMPDIVAKNLTTGEVRVYSCKCLDFTRKVMLPVKELRPEVHKALEIGAPLMLSIWNLADNNEQEIMLDPSALSERIEIRPAK
jgi:energy-coupling factor transporter ATP-binding protein EcfA2